MTQFDPTAMLDRFGPDAPGEAPAMSPEQARAYVRSLTLSHYENFSVLSRLVPERLRDDFASVYAFCRWSDDLGDEIGSTPEARARSLELLGWWRSKLHGCFAHAAGEADEPPAHPVFIALGETVRRRVLPIEPFDDLISAFEMDQRKTRYATWDEVVEYCRLSANPVGRIVLGIGGYSAERDPEWFAMSDATCTALQLTNHWQDVRRDLDDRDRIYLPMEDIGLTEGQLRDWAARPRDPGARVPYIRAMRPLVHRTRDLFRQGRPLPHALANELTPVIWLFGAGGERVLTSVERIGCATLWNRPTLTHADKARLILTATLRFRRRRHVRSRAS